MVNFFQLEISIRINAGFKRSTNPNKTVEKNK